MIRTDGPIEINNAAGTTDVKCALIADTKAEVTNSITGADVDGLDDGDVIGFGSTAFTATGDFAMKKSDGTWSWM